MKIFKRVYYPIMAALVVLMLVLGLVDARVAMSGGKLTSKQVDSAYKYATAVAENDTHNSYQKQTQDNVREYIVSALTDTSLGVTRVPELSFDDELDEDGNNTVDYKTDYEGKTKLPSLYVQKATVAQDSQRDGESEVAVSREINNIILAVPGTSGDAILLHARYDSSAVGGASDAAAVGALIQNATDVLTKVKNGTKYSNTIVFLFSDAGQEGDLGAYAFINQFVGFDKVVSQIRAVADFSAGGTEGTLMVYASSDNALNLVGKYSRFNGSTFASSAIPLLLKSSDYSGSGVFGDFNTLDFTNRGGFNRYATASDVTVNRKLVSQQANAMNKFVSCFADSSVAKIDSKSSAVYFSYLDVMTVYYPVAVAFVIAGIIIGLVIAIIIVNIRNKAFSWGKALAGAAVQIVTLLITAVAALAIYYLLALLMSGFGVVPFHAISSIRFAGTGMLLSASALAIALSIFFYIVLKRTFAVKAVDVVRGNTLIFALLAVILSFALPGISYPFTCVALFALLAMLMTVIFKNKFKNKFSTDIERLFLYVWPIVFALPLIMPLVFTAQTLYPAVSIVVITAIMVALGGFIAPYADYLKPTLDKAFGKLPKRTIRYERTVTEKVEDKAKKGKFTEVTVKKIEKEKVPCRYLNRIGVSVVSVLSVVLILLFCSFNTAYSSAAVAPSEYYGNIYDDSMLFVYESNEGGAANATIEVHDMSAYNYIRYAVNDFAWDEDKGAYTKSYNRAVTDIIPSAHTPGISVSGNVASFTTFDSDYSQITVTLTDASGVTSVTFLESGADAESQSIQYTFEDKNDTLVFRLPYGYGDFTMTVEGSCKIGYEQHVYSVTNLLDVEGNDWATLYDYYYDNKDVGPAIKSGIVVKLTKSM